MFRGQSGGGVIDDGNAASREDGPRDGPDLAVHRLAFNERQDGPRGADVARAHDLAVEHGDVGEVAHLVLPIS
jgi:hypothetical protein